MSVTDLAERVSALRRRLDLSFEKFARAVSQCGCETSSGTIKNLEAGLTSAPNLFVVQAIARLANVSTSEFLGETASRTASEDPRVARFVSLLDGLPSTVIESHLRALESIAAEEHALKQTAPGAKRAA